MNRVRATLFALWLLAVPRIGATGDESMHLVHPEGTGLHLRQLVRGQELHASFYGHAWVTGTLVGQWTGGAANTGSDAPDYVLVPDAAGTRKLPYFFLRDPPYFNRYRVDTIVVTNGAAALRQAAGASQARRLLARQVDKVRVTGAFLIEAYVVGVECDAPWARARVVASRVPDQVAARHLDVPESC